MVPVIHPCSIQSMCSTREEVALAEPQRAAVSLETRIRPIITVSEADTDRVSGTSETRSAIITQGFIAVQ